MNFSNLAQKIAEEAQRIADERYKKQLKENYNPYDYEVETAALKVLNSLELPERPEPDHDNSRSHNCAEHARQEMHDAWTKALEYEEDKLLTERKRLMKRWKEKNDISEESFDDKPQTKGQDRKWCEHWYSHIDGEWQHVGNFSRHGYTKTPPNFCEDCGTPRPLSLSPSEPFTGTGCGGFAENPKLPDELKYYGNEPDIPTRKAINAIIRHLRAKE